MWPMRRRSAPRCTIGVRIVRWHFEKERKLLFFENRSKIIMVSLAALKKKNGHGRRMSQRFLSAVTLKVHFLILISKKELLAS
jgi:hypothetical protein